MINTSVTGGRSVDEDAIKRVLTTYVETWNRHDLSAWARPFTDDGDYVNRGGGWWRSNKENVEGHRVIHDMLPARRPVCGDRSWRGRRCPLGAGLAVGSP